MSLWRHPSPEELRAFEAFVEQRQGALSVLARGLSSGAADAEDLLQETLAKVLERWEQVSAAQDPYLYARRMMVNTSTSTWRRRRRETHQRSAEDLLALGGREGDVLWRQGVGDDRELGDQRGESVLAHLRQLPARQRAVVALRYLEDLPDDRIAELLGIRATTVRSTALRALRALRMSAGDVVQVL